MGMFDTVPGLAGYQQQVQLNQQQDAGQMSKLAQLLQVQEGGMKMQAMQRQLATKDLLAKALQEASAGGQQAPQPAASTQPYGGGYSPQVASIFGVQPGQAQPAQQPVQSQQKPGSMADIYMQAARKAGDPDAIEAALKMQLEEKKVAPKFANEPRVVRGPDGNPMLVQMADDGTVRPIQGGYGPAEKLHFADNGQMAGVGMDQYSGKVLAPGVQKMQSPDSLASNQVTMRGQNMVDARKREELQGAETQFSPEAIKNAAARYNIDGTLPPMGMGKAGSMGRSAILNEAAVQAQGVNPDEQRIQQIGNKANTAALSKLQQQQTMVGAFERNFNMNADLALGLSKQASIDGVPIVSKWIQAGKRSVSGDPTVSAYDVALKATTNEYAKIISGSMGNTAMAEGEIKKVEQLLNAAQTPDQVNAVISFMKQETQNRMKGFDDEKTSLRGSMTGKPAAPSIFKGGTAAPSAPTSGKVVDFGSLK